MAKKLLYINKGQTGFRTFDVDKVAHKYGGEYIADLSILSTHGGWTVSPIAVFWNPKPKPVEGHTHYYGFFTQGHRAMICNAITAAETVWNGAISDEGEIIFSRYQHDHRKSRDKTVWVDGGQDYFWTNAMRLVKLRLNGPDFTYED